MGGASVVGVMGGTFDPIHLGHLVAAEEARLRFGLERVVFMPAGEPPHKRDYEVTPAEHRYAMVALAVAGNPHFEASRLEIERPGPSYTVDTMRFFREQLGPRAGLYFITGADAMLEVLTWHQPEEIARLCEFIAVARPGYDTARLAGALRPEMWQRVRVLDIPGVAVSSSDLRARAARDEALRYLTPPAVAHYIAVHHLYAGREAGRPAG
jgi:nicotinate-nucleotide adenylyltransferase